MDYQQAARLLRIDKHRLDDELETHSDCMCQVSDAVARANTVHLTAKDNLAKVEARVYQTYKESGVKATAADLDGMVTRHPDRVKAWETFQVAREEYERWLGMAEAWRQRSYTITKLADLYCGQYFSLTLTSTTDKDTRPTWQQERNSLPVRRATEITEQTAQRKPLIRRGGK